jgi:tRNA nucleotidyltransferase (CCA-adding enzyme)
MLRNLTPPAVVVELAQRCASQGGRALLVGGSVRDHLMGRGVKDWDIEVFHLAPEKLEKTLRQTGRVNTVGRSFAVFKLKQGDVELDVSIPRRDHKVGPGHRGIEVTGDPDMSFDEAARRRDLTVNAVMLDVMTGELIDPHGGLDDLNAGLLREVDPKTFLEDPLRALRVVQFAARLEFAVDPGLIALCRSAPLDELPAERILGEWSKLMLRSRTPSIGLRVARAADILQRVFPEAAASETSKTLEVVDALAATHRDSLDPEGRRWALMAAGWLHNLDEAELLHSLDRLGLFRLGGYRCREAIVSAIAHRRACTDSDAALRHLSTQAEPEIVLRLQRVVDGLNGWQERHQRAATLGVLTTAPVPLLKGRHLGQIGMRPGRQMGVVLKEAYKRQLDGTIGTVEQAIDWATSVTPSD